MNAERRIKEFNHENAPFYIVNHGDFFSLCLLLGSIGQGNPEYGQYAFDAYAESVGKPVKKDGWYTYGDGYDWECTFKKAFENDTDLSKLDFDCESSGFFVYCADLSTLESLGSRFKALCEDTDYFKRIVTAAMSEADRKAHMDTSPPLIRGTRELRAEDISFDDEIYEEGRKLNFYMESFDGVDEVFGTHVCTDENDDYVNIYVDYDLDRGSVTDTLTLVLRLGNGVDVLYGYQLSDKEKSLLLPKMESYYQKMIGQTLSEAHDEFLAKKALHPVARIDFLGSNGEVGESICYTDAEQFTKAFMEENHCGAPISVVVYRQEDGSTIPLDFLKDISSPIHGFCVEDYSPPFEPEESQGYPTLEI